MDGILVLEDALFDDFQHADHGRDRQTTAIFIDNVFQTILQRLEALFGN